MPEYIIAASSFIALMMLWCILGWFVTTRLPRWLIDHTLKRVKAQLGEAQLADQIVEVSYDIAKLRTQYPELPNRNDPVETVVFYACWPAWYKAEWLVTRFTLTYLQARTGIASKWSFDA